MTNLIRFTSLAALVSACAVNVSDGGGGAIGETCVADSDCDSNFCGASGVCEDPPPIDDPCLEDPGFPGCPGSDDPYAAEFELFPQDNGAVSGSLLLDDAELDPYITTEDDYYATASEVGACNDVEFPPFFQGTQTDTVGSVQLTDGTTTIDGDPQQDGFELFGPAGTFPFGAALDLLLGGGSFAPAAVAATTLADIAAMPAGPIVVNGTIDGNNNLALTDTVSIAPVPDATQMRIQFNVIEAGQPKLISCGMDPAVGTANIAAIRPRLGGGGSFFVEVRHTKRARIVVGGNNRALVAHTIQSKSQGFINNP